MSIIKEKIIGGCFLMIQCKGNCIRLLASSGISRQKRRGVVEEEEGNQTNLRTLMAMIEFPLPEFRRGVERRRRRRTVKGRRRRTKMALVSVVVVVSVLFVFNWHDTEKWRRHFVKPYPILVHYFIFYYTRKNGKKFSLFEKLNGKDALLSLFLFCCTRKKICDGVYNSRNPTVNKRVNHLATCAK
jgi:hypothetical protein